MASGLFFCVVIILTVYVDVLIAINIFVNYFLLLSVRGILKLNVKRYRIFLGALTGGIYSLVIFLPQIPKILTLLMNLTASLAIVLISFGQKRPKPLLKTFLVFFSVNFAFAGLMLAVWLLLKPDGMIYNNSIVYFNIDIKALIILTVVCYFVLTLIFRLSKRSAPDNKIYSVTLVNGGKSVTVNALLDTGNTLRDCFTGKPVIIAESGVISKLFDSQILDFFQSGTVPDGEGKNRIRLIPVNTVSEKGALRASVIDSLTVNDINISVKNVLLSQSKTDFSSGEYSVLLNNEIINERGKRDEKAFFKINN